MKKNIYIGLNSNNNTCCVLKTHINFETLEKYKDDLDTEDFHYSSTDIYGNDSLDRTLVLCGLKLTGREIKLGSPLSYVHTYTTYGETKHSTFSFDTIMETEKE